MIVRVLWRADPELALPEGDCVRPSQVFGSGDVTEYSHSPWPELPLMRRAGAPRPDPLVQGVNGQYDGS